MNRYIIKNIIVILLVIYVVLSTHYRMDIVRKVDREIEENNTFSDEIKDAVKKEKIESKPSNVIGYLYIPDTEIDFVIMQSGIDNPDYYLTHNVYGEYNSIGTPYMSAYCNPNTSDNCIIYGHNINGEKVFGELIKYKNREYYAKHKYIYFTTDKKVQYEIIGVMSINKNTFPYYTFVVAKNDEDYTKFLTIVKQNSIYECNATAERKKKLLTLSTCDNNRGKDYRFVIVAVQKEI